MGRLVYADSGGAKKVFLVMHHFTKAFVLAVLLAIPSTLSMAAVVEVVLIPCTPGMAPSACGLKASVSGGSATFTTADGQTITLAPGTSVSVSGSGIVSQSVEAGPIVNFASLGTDPTTTSSIGSGNGNGGGGGQIAGGNFTGPTNPTNTASNKVSP